MAQDPMFMHGTFLPIGTELDEEWQDYHDPTAPPIRVRGVITEYFPAPDCDCGQDHANFHVTWSSAPLTAQHYRPVSRAIIPEADDAE